MLKHLTKNKILYKKITFPELFISLVKSVLSLNIKKSND